MAASSDTLMLCYYTMLGAGSECHCEYFMQESVMTACAAACPHQQLHDELMQQVTAVVQHQSSELAVVGTCMMVSTERPCACQLILTRFDYRKGSA